MLKPLSSASASPSPRFQPYQYGQPSNRISTSQRRISKPSPSASPISTLAPTPLGQVSYVSRGTQYSPMTERMNDPSPASEPPLEKRTQPASTETRAAQILNAMVPFNNSAPNLDSPTIIKRRQSQDENSSSINMSQAAPPKRVRPAQASVKILPATYESCEAEDMVILIADMISELIETNDDLPLRSGVLTRFHSRTPPAISVKDYLQRLAKHATLTPPLLLSMVYYIDRLCSLYPAFTITTLTVHRFLITAATVASKGLSDSFWNNATYARVGGIKIAELGLLELDFLYRVDWKIVPNPEVLTDYYKGLVERSDGYTLEGDNRLRDNDEEEDEEEKDISDTPESKAEAETDLKWKEWMDDVSIQKAVKEVVEARVG